MTPHPAARAANPAPLECVRSDGRAGGLLVDVRGREEFEEGYAPGGQHVLHGELERRAGAEQE